jgi:hypothetical protein
MGDDDWEVRAEAIRQAKRDRKSQLHGYEAIVGAIEALLFERDPVGINFETNTDEYRPEAETITLRLREATDLDTATQIVHEEFVRWFSPSIAGSEDRYGLIAAEIWALWKEQGSGA